MKNIPPPPPNVQLAKSLTASIPAQDKKIIIMRIVGHISACVPLNVTQGVLKETAVLDGYGSLYLEEITAQTCLF